VFILYSLLFLAAIIGVVSLIMSYDELNRLGLIIAALPVVLTIIVFAKWQNGTLMAVPSAIWWYILKILLFPKSL